MSEKITAMRLVTDLNETDYLTGVDLSVADDQKNIRITKANIQAGLATDSSVAAVQQNLTDHENTGAKTAHPDGINQTDLDNHKSGANQHPISGVTGLQGALDAKADTSSLGNSASRDVGTGSGDVAAGDAPASAVSTHNASGTAHGGNIPTAAQKAALDGNAGLNGVNYVLGVNDVIAPTVEGADLLSTGVAVGQILVSDGADGFEYQVKPGSGGVDTDLDTIYAPDGNSLQVSSSTGTNATILAAVSGGDAGVLTGDDKAALDTSAAHAATVTGNPHNLDSSDVGADSSGTAQGLMDTHNATSNVHQIADVSGLQTALNGKEDDGTAQGIMDTHNATSDVHQIGDVSGLQTSLDLKPESVDIDSILTVTQGEYDGLTPNARTLYIII